MKSTQPPSSQRLDPAALPHLIKLLIPLLIDSLLGLLVGFAGTLLAARISDDAAAAYGITSHIWTMLFIGFRVIGAGVSVVVGHHLGAGQRASADAVARATLTAALWLGGGLSLVTVLGADQLLRLMDVPDAVKIHAAPQLRVLGIVMLMEAFATAMSGVLRAHLHVRSVLTAIFILYATRVLLGVWLIPRVGLVGSASAR